MTQLELFNSRYSMKTSVLIAVRASEESLGDPDANLYLAEEAY